MPELNPRISFGKHKGEFLSEVPESYLRWMLAQPIETHSFEHGGRSWRPLAERELERRRIGGTLDQGLPDIDLDGEGQISISTPTMNQNDKIQFSLSAIDSAVNLHLRSFITRLDKSVQFTAWLADLCREAIAHGESLPLRLDPSEGELQDYVYNGHLYTFNVLKKTLKGITVHSFQTRRNSLAQEADRSSAVELSEATH